MFCQRERERECFRQFLLLVRAESWAMKAGSRLYEFEINSTEEKKKKKGKRMRNAKHVGYFGSWREEKIVSGLW